MISHSQSLFHSIARSYVLFLVLTELYPLQVSNEALYSIVTIEKQAIVHVAMEKLSAVLMEDENRRQVV